MIAESRLRAKQFDAEKLKPFFIEYKDEPHEITDYDVCSNLLLLMFVLFGLLLVFLCGLGIAFSNILQQPMFCVFRYPVYETFDLHSLFLYFSILQIKIRFVCKFIILLFSFIEFKTKQRKKHLYNKIAYLNTSCLIIIYF